MRYDVAVVGLGGMGSASLAHLARRGLRVAGIEQYGRLHENGASTGESRIIRKAYFEDPAYVPMLERTYELWRELESQTHRKLLDLCGILMVGTETSEAIAGTLRSARQWNLPVDLFDADQIARRFPGTTPLPGEMGLLERQAGMVFPEPGVAAHLDVAAAHGADMLFETKIASWDRDGGIHRFTFSDGTTLDAARVAVCAGMWTTKLLPGVPLPLQIQRNVQIWFEPSTSQYDNGVFPTFFLERNGLPARLYGFPAMNGTLKAAFHEYGDIVDADRPDRRIRDADVTAVQEALETWMPGAAARYTRAKVCTYTLTPDRNFIIDKLPGDPTVTIACGFSGHGYKFCPVVGEIVAALTVDGGSPLDIGFLSASRFVTA